MLIQNFATYLGGSANSVRRSGYDLIGYIQALKYMPALICIALFFSSNSHSFNGHKEHDSSSTQGSYKASLHIDNPDIAILNFSGNTPWSIDGFAPYTIYSFNLKIGENEYPLTEHNRYTQLVSHLKLKDLNYIVHNFPKSELIFSYGLSFFQSILEHGKCISEHSGFFRVFLFWDTLPNFKLQACWKKVRSLTFQKKYHSIDITDSLVKAIEEIHHEVIKTYDTLPYKNLLNNLIKDKSISLSNEDKQSIYAYVLATYDYFHERQLLILEAYDRLQLLKNIITTLDDHSSSEQNELLYKSVKSFQSKNCADDLANNLPITMDDESPRLSLSAKNYATKICRYNLISLNDSAANSPAKHAGLDLDLTSPAFRPYAYCDKYTCEIHMSETLYYRLSFSIHDHDQFLLHDQDQFLFHAHLIDWMKYSLLLKSKNPDKFSDCSNYCTISDIDALQYTINTLKELIYHEDEDYQRFVSWIISKNEKQLN